jgi:hypothetical protein
MNCRRFNFSNSQNNFRHESAIPRRDWTAGIRLIRFNNSHRLLKMRTFSRLGSINRTLTPGGAWLGNAYNLGIILSPMDRHRIAPRRRLLKAGSIQFGGGVIDCVVRNISETGAALEVLTPLYIPDRFTLFVQTDQLKRACRVVWRKEKRMGVKFD